MQIKQPKDQREQYFNEFFSLVSVIRMPAKENELYFLKSNTIIGSYSERFKTLTLKDTVYIEFKKHFAINETTFRVFIKRCFKNILDVDKVSLSFMYRENGEYKKMKANG